MAAIKQLKLLDNTVVDIKDEISGYQTAADVQTAISGKQDTLISGTNIKTINNQSILGSGNIDIGGELDFLTPTEVHTICQIILV